MTFQLRITQLIQKINVYHHHESDAVFNSLQRCLCLFRMIFRFDVLWSGISQSQTRSPLISIPLVHHVEIVIFILARWWKILALGVLRFWIFQINIAHSKSSSNHGFDVWYTVHLWHITEKQNKIIKIFRTYFL